MKKIKITKNISIGADEPVFIIAEVGVNHNGDLGIAKKMIDVAKESGADAVKFQTFKADEFISDPKQTITYKSRGKMVTESAIKMFKRYELPESAWKGLYEHCKKKKILFFSTPQNPSDLDLLLKIIDLPIIKIGSDDLTNINLIKYYASKQKPLIIAAGMAYLSEIEDAVAAVKSTGNDKLAVLHCVSSYPAMPEEVNMRKMQAIASNFDVVVGFSDHTRGIEASILATAMGAKIIEKHFTLNNDMAGPDHWFSSNPKELKELIQAIRKTEKMIGSDVIEPTKYELETRKDARRSITAKKDINKGDIISDENLEFKRPGTGLPPKLIVEIVGTKSTRTIKKGEMIKKDDYIN